MLAAKRTVWEVASDVREIVHKLDLPRFYPSVDVICFVGLQSVQLEVKSPHKKQRDTLINTILARLKEKYEDWHDFYEVRYEKELAIIILGGENLQGMI
ncbi:MAG: hypothetical protein ACE5NP_05835 [Anaerolineae bacterium]